MGKMIVDCCALCSAAVLFAKEMSPKDAAVAGCLAGISSVERCGVGDIIKGFCPTHKKLYDDACAYADKGTGFEKAS